MFIIRITRTLNAENKYQNVQHSQQHIVEEVCIMHTKQVIRYNAYQLESNSKNEEL